MKKRQKSSLRTLRFSLVAAACTLLTACTCFDFGTGVQAIPKAEEILKPSKDVGIVVVSSTGRVYPKRLIVRKDLHAIVWVADGETLKINFVNAPFTVECEGAICWTGPISTPTEAESPYVYDGVVTKNGTPKKLDPKLEVVP
jgi:hypothetical protein